MSDVKMDALAELRKVKVPWWAHAVGWWNSRRLRKAALREKRRLRHEVKHVATVFVWYQITDQNNSMKCIWYICRETGAGVRSYEFGSQEIYLSSQEKRNKEYARVIAPWINKGYTNQALIDYAKRSATAPIK